MKKFLFLFLLLAAFVPAVKAQPAQIQWVNALPATCQPDSKRTTIVYKYVVPRGIYYCSAINTWSSVGAAAATEYRTSNFGNSLSSSISAIGGTNADLVVDANITTSSVSVPSNVRLVFRNNAVITVSNAQTLTIAKMEDPGNVKVFTLAGTGAVRFSKGAIDTYRTAWITDVTDGVDITAALTQLTASTSINHGGIIQIPEGNWLTTGAITVPIGTTIKGTTAFSTGGTFGTVLKMSSVGTYVLKIPGVTAGVRIEDITIDGDSKATDGILFEDAFPNTSYDVVLRHISVTNCVEGIYVHATDTFWQLELLTIEQSMFVNNSHAGIRYATLNGSMIVKDGNFQVPDNGFGIYIDNGATISLYNPQFAGLAGSLGYTAGEPNAGMAEGAIRVVGQVYSLDIFNSQDEGFRDFIRHSNLSGFAGGPINIHGGVIQSLIRLEGQVSLNIDGGKYWRRIIRDNASGSSNITAKGYSLFPTALDGVAGTAVLYDTFTGSTMRQDDAGPELFQKNVELPEIRFKPTAMGSYPTTSPYFGVFADNAYTDQCLIGFGASTAISTILSGNRFCIGRTTSNGHAFFTGTQVGRAYDFDAPLTATGLITGSAFTTAGALTANSGVITTNLTVAADPYSGSWNGSAQVPQKDAVFDQLELYALWNTVPKVSDQTKTANTTLAADSALTFNLVANKTYSVEIEVFFDTTAAGDFKYSLTGPAAPTLVRVRRAHVIPGTTADVVAIDVAYTASTSVVGTGTTGGWLKMTLTIQNGVNAGAFAFNWAQDTSDAGNTTVRGGSYLRYRQVN